MVGAIAANLHEGSRSEYLAQYVFASFGTAVSVPNEASKSAIPSRLSIPANNKTPPSDDSRPPSNRAHNSLPATGDKPGR